MCHICALYEWPPRVISWNNALICLFRSYISVLTMSWLVLLACADEHDFVLAVLSFHTVHYQLSELVLHVRAHNYGLPTHRLHRVVHGWVQACKCYYIIGKVFGGVKTSERFAGTLQWVREGDEGLNFLMQRFRSQYGILNNVV